MRPLPAAGQSNGSMLNSAASSGSGVDFIGAGHMLAGGSSGMVLPNTPLSTSGVNYGMPPMPLQQTQGHTHPLAYGRPHGGYMAAPEAAPYVNPKQAAEVAAYPAYGSAMPGAGFSYPIHPPAYAAGGMHFDAMKSGYMGAPPPPAGAQGEYLHGSLLPFSGRPGVGVGAYGALGASSLGAGYYGFPPMQGAYDVQGAGSKRKLESSGEDEAKRRKAAKPKPHKKKSKYRGVFWHSRGKAWVSSIMVNGKTTHLGYYDCEVEAARVYDKEAIRLKGVTCAVNFPDSVERFGKNQDATTATDNKRSTRHERKRAERISKYRGVCWNKCNSSWKACIKIDGRNKHIGYFSSEKDAAKAYDLKARKVRGASAKLNFPEEAK